MDLTGFMFFIIEQENEGGLETSISLNLEPEMDSPKVACDDRLCLSESRGSTVRLRPNRGGA